MLRDDPPAPTRTRERRTRTSVGVEAEAVPGSFEALRAWRAAEAKSQAVPPYVIFHDSVLQDVAAVQPRSLDALAQIKGVGASKLERYGDAVLRVIAEQAG
jgi:ATP-dependent DNA helicase RecQ